MIKRKTSAAGRPLTNCYLVSYCNTRYDHPLSEIVEWDGITRANIEEFQRSKRRTHLGACDVYVIAVTKLDRKWD